MKEIERVIQKPFQLTIVGRGSVGRADIKIANFRIATLNGHDILASSFAVHIPLIFGAQTSFLQMVVTRIVQRHRGETTHVRVTKAD